MMSHFLFLALLTDPVRPSFVLRVHKYGNIDCDLSNEYTYIKIRLNDNTHQHNYEDHLQKGCKFRFEYWTHSRHKNVLDQNIRDWENFSNRVVSTRSE